jgi:hypothetical protein
MALYVTIEFLAVDLSFKVFVKLALLGIVEIVEIDKLELDPISQEFSS